MVSTLERLRRGDAHRLYRTLRHLRPQNPELFGGDKGVPDDPSHPGPAAERFQNFARRLYATAQRMPPLFDRAN